MDQIDILFLNTEELRACRVCLSTEKKLFDLHSNHLAELFSDITTIPVLVNDGLPQQICSMCRILLRKAAAFKAKCNKTHAFLQRSLLLQPITMEYLRNLDRTHLDLPLSISDPHILDYPNNDNIVCSNDNISLNDDIKLETEVELELQHETLDFDGQESKDDIFENQEFKEEKEIKNVPHSNNQTSKRDDVTPIIKKEAQRTRNKSIKVSDRVNRNDKTAKNKNKAIRKRKVKEAKAVKSDSDDTDDEDLVLSKFVKNSVINPAKQKVKSYLVRCKEHTKDYFSKTFYDFILNKYIDKTREVKKLDSKIDILDLNNENCFIKTEDHVTEETCNQFIENENTKAAHKIFYSYIKEKYINEKRPEEIKKLINKYKLEVKLKIDKRGVSQEDLDKFGKTYNFEIINMSKEEQIREVQARKETTQYKNSSFKCEECCRGFSSEIVFKNHMGMHDPNNGSHVCEICRVRSKTRKQMMDHLRHHTTKFICKICNRHFYNRSMAKYHCKTHEGVEYECQHCSKTFRKYASRVNHIRIHHGNTECDICYATLRGPAALMVHKTKLHKQIFPCNICNVNFDNPDALKRHANSTPVNACDPQMRPCCKCGQNFATEDLLKGHIQRVHIKPRPGATAKPMRRKRKEPCCPCYKQERSEPHIYENTEYKGFKSYDGDLNSLTENLERNGPHGNLERSDPHGDLERSCVKSERVCPCVGTDSERDCPCSDERKRPRHRPTTHVCEMCAKTFNNLTSLRYHQLIHTGEKPHPCTYCDKRFRVKESLEQHLRTHTGDRPYKCSQCDKAFTGPSNLYRHQLVHTKERRHRCTYCEKMFLTSTCLKTHIRTVHMKIPAKPRDRSRKRNFE